MTPDQIRAEFVRRAMVLTVADVGTFVRVYCAWRVNDVKFEMSVLRATEGLALQALWEALNAEGVPA